MNQSVYVRGLKKLVQDGPVEFFQAVFRFISIRLRKRLDIFAKENPLFSIPLIFVWGLLKKELIIKTPQNYVRYTPFCDNMFGGRKYYFPDLKHHRQIERYEYHNEKYFLNDDVFIKPSDTVLEIGAARGITTQIAAQRAERVIAFEPSPRGFSCLEKNIKKSNIELYQYAAWNEPDELEMKYGEQSGDDSLIDPNSGTTAISEKVRADTIENFAQELNIPQIDFLKVEAEGAEPEVIEGIRDLYVDRIVVNCSAERYGESPADEVGALLQEKGYSIIDVTEGSRLYAKKNV